MAVVFDASVLIDLFNTRLTGDRRARLDHLVESLKKQRTTVLTPAPALAQFLVSAGKARERYLNEISNGSSFSIESFDQRAAIECASLLEEAWARGQRSKVAHTKFKFDWQIVAIAASRNATVISSDDTNIAHAAARLRIPVHGTDTLPLPGSARQQPFPGGEPQSEGGP